MGMAVLGGAWVVTDVAVVTAKDSTGFYDSLWK